MVIFVYLLNLFYKKSSEGKDRSNKDNSFGQDESTENPYEEIRRDILRKKKERTRLEKSEAELAMEADKAQGTEAKNIAVDVDEPNSIQLHLDKQAQIIKKQQEDAERLKVHLEQTRRTLLKEKAIDRSAFSCSPILARDKVRSMLAQKSDIKAALIVGEILSQPLALRTKFNSKAINLMEE